MFSIDDYQAHDATALAQLVQQKKVTPSELIDCAQTISEKINPSMNAIVTPLFDEARETLFKDRPSGFFAGVPFLVKDLGCDLKGVRTSQGSRACANFIAEEDSPIVTAYKNSGLMIVGKTNTAEFGLSWVTESEFLGPCRNPLDLTRTPGGSSGGSAAAVAAGITPMAHASDGGGSIRVPASCCGLFGLKPSRGLLPTRKDNWAGLSVAHVITKSVRDSATMLAIEAGFAPDYFLQALVTPKPLKIAMSVGDHRVDPECVRAVQHAKQLCESLGHTVVVDAPHYDAQKMWQARLVIVSYAVFQSLQSVSQAEVERFSWDFAMHGKRYTLEEVTQAMQVLSSETGRAADFFNKHDLLLTPTIAMLPPKIGRLTYTGDDPIAYGTSIVSEFVPWSTLANDTGFPAMSVPLYRTDEGLPVGVQFMGRLNDDALLLSLAEQLLR